MPTIGVIGLGKMGSQMSERLLERGFELLGYDVRTNAIERIQAAGGEGAASAAGVAESTDLVITSLPNPDAVEDVFCGDNGLFDANCRTLTVLEASTSTPGLTRALAGIGAEEGINVIDAPVSGGTSGARNGTLTFMIGATESALDPVAVKVLNTLGQHVFYLDDIGSGHATKLVNNTLTAGHRALAMEAMALGVALDVDPEQLFDVISNASGSSNQFEKRVPRVLNRNFEPTFTLDLTKKDIRLALRTADDIDYPMPITGLVHERHKEASAKGYGGEDACAVVKVCEEYLDVLVEAEGEVDESFGGY